MDIFANNLNGMFSAGFKTVGACAVIEKVPRNYRSLEVERVIDYLYKNKNKWKRGSSLRTNTYQSLRQATSTINSESFCLHFLGLEIARM